MYIIEAGKGKGNHGGGVLTGNRKRGNMKQENIKEKNDAEIKEVIHIYGNMLYRTAYVILGNPSDVQDVLQEALIKYMEKAPAFREEAHRKAWLLKITVNLCKDCLRFNKRHAYVPLEELGHLQATSAQQGLLKEIIALPAKWKSILLLHYVEGYSISEVSLITGLSQSAVKKRLQRGRERLKQQLTESEEFYGQYE